MSFLAAAIPSVISGLGNFLGGSPGKIKNVSRLTKEQQPLLQQLIQSGMAPGAGGAFGTAADYYRNLLGDNSADFDAFAAPEMRRYREDIVPGISEQFAGMGSGGLSSSGFRNAQMQGATDLAERLGTIRANLRQNAAAGLANIGQMGLGNFSQPMQTQQGSEGFLSAAAPGAGSALTQMGGNWLQNKFGGNSVGKNTGPYNGANVNASPKFNGSSNLPNFLG